MLRLVGIKPIDNGLPSWVVDWINLETYYCCKNFASFRAGGREEHVRLKTDDTMIGASGEIVDRVIAIGDSFKAEIDLWDRPAQCIDNCTHAFGQLYSGKILMR